MIKVTVSRYNKNGQACLGVLNVLGKKHKSIYTLEKPDLDNQQNISCIPEGIYQCKPYSSPKYPDVYQICDVLNRTNILIHIGNYPRNTWGCILVGFGVMDNLPAVSTSKLAMELLRDLIGRNEFKLEIGNLTC